MLPFISFIVVARRLCICVAGHLNNRLLLNIRCPQLLSTTSCRKELLDWNRRNFLPSKVFILLLRLSVHLRRSASYNFLAGEDVLLFPRAQTWTDITHGLVQLSTCSQVLLNAGQGLPAWISNSPVRTLWYVLQRKTFVTFYRDLRARFPSVQG